MRLFTAIAIVSLMLVGTANAAPIALWTFETSVPTTAGPYAPEVGSGSALGAHAGATVYSNPVGNGSAESFSSTYWAVGDYYQFQVSTVGQSNIGIAWDQTSSNTGPRDFVLQYSTDGVNFTSGATYSVLANAAPNIPWTSTSYNAAYHFSIDLSSVTGLNNQSAVYFRLTDNSTVSASGGIVATGGTDRVDNVEITPEPATLALLGLGGLLLRRRRK